MTHEERFWSHVNKTDTCWLWTLSCSPSGYGKFSVDGKDWRAHRYAWTITYGPIPEGFRVCHRCDNPPCVRPTDLFLGTDLDNQRDCVIKGRARFGDINGARKHPEIRQGERNGGAKLTVEQVREIRELRISGLKLRELSTRFHVSIPTIKRVVRVNGRRYWLSVT